MKKGIYIFIGFILVFYGLYHILAKISDFHTFRELGNFIDKIISVIFGIYLIIKGSKPDKNQKEDNDEEDDDIDYNEEFDEEKK